MSEWLCLVALHVVFARPCAAEIIPASRRMIWTPGAGVGVPGGIPERTTIFVNIKTTDSADYRCVGDGTTDESAHLQAALKACPAGQVVYAPAGTYRPGFGI
jgi:hypothetical protein